MPTLSDARLQALLQPYLGDEEGSVARSELYGKLGAYLDLLVRWNRRTNLSAIREPEEIVCRHFGESLFAARRLAGQINVDATVLDFGSGAGFPGIPMQLWQPQWRVTLAESQGKKAAFLRETVRVLELPTDVWSARVEAMPPERTFDAVAMRAVDCMEAMMSLASRRVRSGGVLLTLTSDEPNGDWSEPIPERDGSFVVLRTMN